MTEKNKDTSIKKIVEQIKRTIQIKNKDDKRIKQLEIKFFKEFCLKQYLKECEPGYCVFRITNSCEYVKILKKVHTI
ncbi:MAG: hypothetical protein MPEBLZ_03994 [Candidatus Methanoperedens nitroreducens]|uniref:Uncharacterized protein n=1 Tax=Candidatus Methanoperedens nitratireducens TaxID=1392998 RepID=A0A0P7ZD94_9EURY|nr:hypothetical protein [Candidatus Methanoperedens sp. BLZ2]KAB2945597.1 MAG: hypothetical protein F9K14_10065 [Candidatus Methanoperedens sp.]KPQ41451.1 MAG: hypothetical protein MPEBLZ_03994 [Candidatus Methanoperedens sp. BLZ1]MBZ0176114.1 hypothetical protein [Candidatus Methanoperedens nitroreducens]CAG0962273.1 hypothetical protein METP2_00868 [Methanosarcinales archaeon]MCX9079363.1 hypothetical protein [Candidatus Methanoperedens sp.]